MLKFLLYEITKLMKLRFLVGGFYGTTERPEYGVDRVA